MADYAQAARKAAQSLLKSGATITLSWKVPFKYDPANPKALPPPPVTVRAAGVVLPYSSRVIGTQTDSLIRAGDQQLLLAAVDINGEFLAEPPPEASALLADGTTWTVKNPRTLAPAGIPVMFDITLRR